MKAQIEVRGSPGRPRRRHLAGRIAAGQVTVRISRGRALPQASPTTRPGIRTAGQRIVARNDLVATVRAIIEGARTGS